MNALIGSWRGLWGQEFPFYYVQLANWLKPTDIPSGDDRQYRWQRCRMGQFKALSIPKTGMAVTIDIGDAEDIHPRNKFDVGERLALWALAKDYGKTDLVWSGPLYKGMKVEGNKVRIRFDSVGSGLMVGRKDGRNPTVEDKAVKLKRFAVAGADKKWVWADAYACVYRIDFTKE
jgi:sialate O-acetylesterase